MPPTKKKLAKKAKVISKEEEPLLFTGTSQTALDSCGGAHAACQELLIWVKKAREEVREVGARFGLQLDVRPAFHAETPHKPSGRK